VRTLQFAKHKFRNIDRPKIIVLMGKDVDMGDCRETINGARVFRELMRCETSQSLLRELRHHR